MKFFYETDHKNSLSFFSVSVEFLILLQVMKPSDEY